MTAGTDDVVQWLRAEEQKELLRFVAVGSVDDGKSTLMGRLLHDAHGVYEDQLRAARRSSARQRANGAGPASEIDFSLFTDGLVAEREQGITIDVAYRYFATHKRKFIVADTPGHVQYTRNMATGASTADAAIILVDARLGVLPQTRRHAYIAALLGIPHLVACVNKMDLLGFEQTVFEKIQADLGAVAAKLGIPHLLCIPVSALEGDNVVHKSARTPWWSGQTLLDVLETLPIDGNRNQENFRYPVQYVLRPNLDYRGFAGQIVSGAVRKGDEVIALPSRRRTRVAAVDEHGKEIDEAFAPKCVALRLADEIDVSRGEMLVHAADVPRVDTDFEATVVWMSERPLDRQRSYLLRHTTRTVRAVVDQVVSITRPDTLEPEPAEGLALNDIGHLRIHCHKPIFFDAYKKNRATGAFILIDSVTNDTVAAGMILDATGGAHARSGNRESSASQVSPAERRTRLRQSGAVVRVSGPDAAARAALAYAIERELFDRGRVAAVIDDANAAKASAAAGIVAIVAVEGAEPAIDANGAKVASGDADALVRDTLAALEAQAIFD